MTDLAQLIASLRAGTVTPADQPAAADALAGKVAVKPLEWKWSERFQDWRAGCELTRDVFIAYQTGDEWSAGSQLITSTYRPTADDAKGHLDQSRAARILAALKHAPLTVDDALAVPEVRALVDALRDCLMFLDNDCAYISSAHQDRSKARAALRGIGGVE